MGGGGGKKNILNDISGGIGTALASVQNDPVNAALNIMTGGLVGSEGPGVAITGSDELIGELSGRNLQRKAQMEAKDAIKAEQAAKRVEIKNEQDKRMRQDVSASTRAGSRRNAQMNKNKVALGNQEQDFLGL